QRFKAPRPISTVLEFHSFCPQSARRTEHRETSTPLPPPRSRPRPCCLCLNPLAPVRRSAAEAIPSPPLGERVRVRWLLLPRSAIQPWKGKAQNPLRRTDGRLGVVRHHSKP